ncbi:hypothetical protein D3C86_1806520 [compost metagenome]
MGNALVNQTCFFFTADHLHRTAEDFLRFRDKIDGVHCQSQRCGGDNTNLIVRDILKAFCEETQALPTAFHRFRREIIIAAQARRETDLALDARQGLNAPRHLAYNQHMKTIRT